MKVSVIPRTDGNLSSDAGDFDNVAPDPVAACEIEAVDRPGIRQAQRGVTRTLRV
jgi:hypothetical protein